MKTEHAFFERLANLGQGDWTVKLQPHMVPGQMDLASYTARVYLVDTSTGWTAAGALQPSGFAGRHADIQDGAADRLGRPLALHRVPDAGRVDHLQTGFFPYRRARLRRARRAHALRTPSRGARPGQHQISDRADAQEGRGRDPGTAVQIMVF